MNQKFQTTRTKHCILLCLLTTVSLAQSPSFKKALSENTFTLIVVNDSFAGSGKHFITEALSHSHHILVGEQHGIAETSQFIRALLMQGESSGFKTLAIETDPYVAKILTELHRTKKPIESARKRFQEMPFLMPFFENENDHHMLTALDYSKDDVLWGLDQVFMGATRLIFERLLRISENDEQERMMEELLEKAKFGVRQVIETGNFQHAMMLQFTNDSFESLKDTFQGKDEAIQLINDLEESKEIYMLNFQGRIYDNNFLRSKLMKRNFFSYYNRSNNLAESPKVIYKFGDTHMAMGHSFTDVLDIGNAVFEYSSSAGKRSTHILFHGLEGAYNAFNPVSGEEAKRTPFDNSAKFPQEILEVVSNGNKNDKEWIIIDLRPLRKYAVKAEPKLRSYLLSFDFFVIVPKASPTLAF